MSRYYVEYIKEYIKTSLLLHWAPGFPSSTLAANPIQFIQIATAQLVFTFPKLSHFTALRPALQWLPVGAPSHFKTPVLPYKTARGAVTQNHQIRIQTCTPTQSLHSNSRHLPFIALLGPIFSLHPKLTPDFKTFYCIKHDTHKHSSRNPACEAIFLLLFFSITQHSQSKISGHDSHCSTMG